MSTASITGYNRWVRATLIVIYLVIVAGGVVRCTGSGMGCPDWPKCFGRWVPPTDVSQLPSNYIELYSSMGYHSTEFNVQKTWTEYLNRLLGALSGVFVLGACIYSFRFRSGTLLKILSCATLITILFQGWLGAKVVDSNLAPYMITIHMFFALLIVSILIVSMVYSSNALKMDSFNSRLLNFSSIVLVLTFIQILLGTQVRMRVDQISSLMNFSGRELWIDMIGVKFYIHRSFSILILLLNLYFVWLLINDTSLIRFRTLAYIDLVLILVIILSGVLLNYFSLPSWVQPIHLSVSSIIFGVQFYLFVHLRRIKSGLVPSSNL